MACRIVHSVYGVLAAARTCSASCTPAPTPPAPVPRPETPYQQPVAVHSYKTRHPYRRAQLRKIFECVEPTGVSPPHHHPRI